VDLMVTGTSAVVAILFDEPGQRRYEEAIEAASVCLVSAVTRVELSFVIEGRKRDAGRQRLERFFAMPQAEIVAVTPQ
jgi:ribonuclease VapC